MKFDSVRSLGPYEGELRAAVLRLKRPHEESLARAVTGLVCETIGPDLVALDADVIAPVPMYFWRRTLRGVNGPELIAEFLGRDLGLPLARRLLVRRRNTRLQIDLSATERRRNVQGAFRASAGYHLDGARVVLVDDVLTTGATCSEASKILRGAGADCVHVVVLARSVVPG